jgi:hypothetical protein
VSREVEVVEELISQRWLLGIAIKNIDERKIRKAEIR